MTPTQSIKTCLRKYVSISGRASRAEFWWFALAILTAEVVFLLVATILSMAFPLGVATSTRAMVGFFGNIPPAIFFATMLPLLAASVRRLHDQGKSGAVAFKTIGLLFLSFIVIAFSTMMFDSCDARPEECDFQLYLWAGFLPSALFFGIIFAYFFSLRHPSDPSSNAYGPASIKVTS